LSGLSGQTLWDSTPIDPGAGRQPAGFAVSDWNGDGLSDVVFQGPTTQVLSGVNGALMSSGGPATPYFMPTLYDVDGDGVLEITLNGGLNPAQTLKHDATTPIWVGSQDDHPYPFGAMAPCANGPVLVEGSWAYPARLKLSRASGPTAGAFQTMVLAGGQRFDDEAGATQAGFTLGQLTSASVHSNLTGAGRPSALVGSTDGHLYSINPCTGELDFSYEFADPVGGVVFGDTDGDGRDEILVTSADGYLYALKNEAIAPPPYVWDIDLAHGVTTDVDDINTVDTLYCAWGAVDGAKGYRVAVVNAKGDFVTSPSWIDASASPATLSGLHLKNNARYTCAVQAMSATGPSPDALSDGVVVHLGDGGASGGGGPGGGGPAGGAGTSSGGGGSDVLLSGRACTCRAAGASSSDLPAWAALALAGLVLRRRRACPVRARASRR
jgi:MYXO-CTERM domain-containing protein